MYLKTWCVDPKRELRGTIGAINYLLTVQKCTQGKCSADGDGWEGGTGLAAAGVDDALIEGSHHVAQLGGDTSNCAIVHSCTAPMELILGCLSNHWNAPFAHALLSSHHNLINSRISMLLPWMQTI